MSHHKAMTPLLDGLKQYRSEVQLRFHMPGHFGVSLPVYQELLTKAMDFDVTEVAGTDHLYEATGILKESQECAARIYGAQRSYYLVNGSTVGLHAAIDALVPDGAQVVIGRNAHHSVHQMARRKALDVRYAYPSLDPAFGIEGALTLTQVLDALTEKTHAVILTSPTYYGAVSDLAAIYAVLRQRGILLIVDAAHGAHFAFHAQLPDNPVVHCDVCVMSLHKMLPAFTQCAILHAGARLSAYQLERLSETLRFYQTSSPSYLLLSSCELSIAYMVEQGEAELARLASCALEARRTLARHPMIRVYESADYGKLLVHTPLLGSELQRCLRARYRIETELSIGQSVLFLLGVTHSAAELARLVGAIIQIVDTNRPLWQKETPQLYELPHLERLSPERQKQLRAESEEKRDKQTERVMLQDAIGRVLAENVIPYPPGIPVLMEFEILTEEAIAYARALGYETLSCYCARP